MRPDDPKLGPTSITVGCANFESIPGDTAATLEKLLAQVEQAARRGCDLVVFPELALNSWAPCERCARHHRPCPWHLGEAEPADGPSFAAIGEAAARHQVHVIYGFAERDAEEPDTLYNSANVVAPDGLVGTYRKLHLGIPLETDRFTPGRALPVFDTALGPIGISICYDFYNNPELTRVLAMKGARLLVNPTGRGDLPRAREHVEQTTLVRAHENLVCAVSANRVGSSAGPRWAGGSVICTTRYPGYPETLARAGTEEELITATLDFTGMARWWDLLPWREWRTGPQAPITGLVAEELAALVEQAEQTEPAKQDHKEQQDQREG